MARVADFEDSATATISGSESVSRTTEFYYLSKRAIDIFASIILLLIFSPIMLAISILVKLDSSGPAIFSQKRIGSKRCVINGRVKWKQSEFIFYKFRTMVDRADPSIHHQFIEALINHDEQKIHELNQTSNPLKKLTNDKRITRLGHFLRRSSLDELPQFWNVLLGDMSLIGPRPAIPYEVEMYKPWYFRRFEAKPGLTGWWQVKARNSCDFDEMMGLDIEYIQNQSLWMDIKIMLLTPLAILCKRGAA